MNKIDNINNAVLEGRYGPYVLPSGYTGGTGKSTSTNTSINTGIALDTNDFTLELECQAANYGGEDWNIMQSTESGLGDNGQIGFCGRSPYVYYNNISNNANTYLNTGIYDDTDDVEYDIVTKINTQVVQPWYGFQSKGGNVSNNIAGLSGNNNIIGLVVTTQGNSSVTSSIGTLSSSDWYHINFKHKNGIGTLQVTNLDHPATATDTFTYTDYTASDTPICLFGNIAGDRAAANNSIMSVKLIKNDVVVMDYEPVTYNNTAGFYDKVSRTFKTATSGSLVANTLSSQRALSASIGSTLLLSNIKRANTHIYFLCLEYKDNVVTFRTINETTGEVDTISANVPYSSITGYSAPVYIFGDGNTRTTADSVTVYHTRIRKDGALVLDGVIASRTSPSSTGGIYNFASSSFITRSGGNITVSGGIRQGTFYENKYITSVDLSNTPWYNNSMYSAFEHCTNLTAVSNINNAVTDMQLAFGYCNSLTNVAALPTSVTNLVGTFLGCTSLTDAPTIPSSVVALNSTFERCSSLVNIPTLPSSITDLSNTFRDCTSLVNAPVIPSSVTTMSSTFRECTSLTGDIVINSSVVNNVSACFANTSLDKYVYIPYNSTTYNTFIAAGYDEAGTKEGVYLRDLSSYQG